MLKSESWVTQIPTEGDSNWQTLKSHKLRRHHWRRNKLLNSRQRQYTSNNICWTSIIMKWPCRMGSCLCLLRRIFCSKLFLNVRRSQYTISLRPVYNKILRLPLTCVRFLPSRAVTMQSSQAPHTTNPSTSASTEKQQPRLQQLPYCRACGKNNSPPDRCLTLETKIHSADILLSFNNFSWRFY